MKQIEELLSKYPLYKKISIEAKYQFPNALCQETFTFHCENCKDTRTFELRAFPRDSPFNSQLPDWGTGINKDYKGNIYWVQHYKGICQFCKRFHCDIIINAIQTKDGFFLRKIGQFPPYAIKPEKVVLDYLDEEDKGNYEKALMCYSHSYGIGSFAYFRRIVENEIKKIITDIAVLETPELQKIKQALTKYEQNHQMAILIEKIYPYLPSSLKELGDNPIKILYEQLSVGIHSLSEDECIEKATLLDSLLTFIIKKICEEKTDVTGIKAALKKFKR
jgi:hypothetical protein